MLDFAIDLAYRAGALLRAAAERERSTEAKQHSDLVSDADRASEALIIGAIRERFPDHAILAEESGASAGAGSYTWVIDPLDGTLNYVHGFPFYSVSIALAHNREPLLGVVFDPLRSELFAAERGQGARVNGRRLRVSATASLGAALLTTGFPYSRFSQPDNNLREFARLSLRAREIRRSGSAALELCYVAAGRSDGHWELELNPWDLAAGALLVREAGGVVSDWQGQPWALEERRVVASNGHVHAELLAELSAAG
jgi:myo-inositol-1(or 4)-monophosphatase